MQQANKCYLLEVKSKTYLFLLKERKAKKQKYEQILKESNP